MVREPWAQFLARMEEEGGPRPPGVQTLDDRMAAAQTRARAASPCATVEAVRADLLARSRFGLAKYGTTVAANPLTQREWLRHAYEEALDLAVYLRRVMDGADG